MKKIFSFILILSLTAGLSLAQNVSDMLENALSSVVTVAVYKTGIANQTLGFRGETVSDVAYEKALSLSGALGSGSGFIISRNGKKYVVTNAHVIQDASDERGSIYIFSIDGTKYEVKVVGGDSFYDIALLEFIGSPGNEITSIDFKKAESRIGEPVYAIGNPLGEYPYSVSNGIISAKNRVREGITGKFGFLQTTATIIWGNSGGPLVDASGKVAGVNTKIAFATSPDGEEVIQSQINFAVEAKIVERIVNDVLTYEGRVRRAYFGIEISQSYNYEYVGSDNYTYVLQDTLAIISAVIPNSPASQNLNNYIGYAVLQVNGVKVRNVEEVLGEFEKITPGANVTLKLANGSTSKTVSIKSSELKENELEAIALYVMEQVSNIKLLQKEPQLAVSVESENYYKYEEKQFSGRPINKKPGYNGNSSQSASKGEKYFMLAAGIVGENYQSMWKITDLRYFGAALKLCGMSGVIDMYLLKPHDDLENMELLRYYLSGDEDVMQSTLWY
ncbi:MAG: trypsin-like serine protease [Bacteroidetes bacterium]|jgi:S1-C subfamily serine protease|nr:trypsin-like serine protease [Bacteroidota bacterium]MBT5530158.1 trypsin-like serine protease [Cytophagia bacterium]MBT3934813.1 trypsin-like serine protease [Bacteroidota bacterium]MBT4338079.1 trypsin-like serine protease [Bacteroidota bacterium]MBT4729989.1 trypsin-like serine protease [Bacteroidota bacterium]